MLLMAHLCGTGRIQKLGRNMNVSGGRRGKMETERGRRGAMVSWREQRREGDNDWLKGWNH